MPTVALLAGLVWLLFSASGLGFLVAVASRFLPDSLEIHDLSGRLVGPLFVGEISYRDSAIEIVITEATVQWQPSQLFWNDAFVVDSVRIERIEITQSASSERADDSPVVELGSIEYPSGLTAPIDARIGRLDVEEISFSNPDVKRSLGRLEVSASWLGEELTIDRLALSGDTLDVVASARIGADGEQAVDVDLQHSLRLEGLAPIDGQLTIRGVWDDLRLGYRSTPPYQANLDLTVAELSSQPRLSGDFWLDGVALEQIADDFPEATLSLQSQLTGELSAVNVIASAAYVDQSESGPPRFDARTSLQVTPSQLVLSALELAIEGQPKPVQFEGVLSWADQLGSQLQVSWQSLTLPIYDDQSAESRGSLSIRGWLDSYDIALDGSVAFGGVNAPLVASATGDRDSLDLSRLRLGLGEAEVTGQGRLDWGSDQNGVGNSLKLSARQLDPSIVDARLAGLLDADLELSVTQAADELRVIVPMGVVRGELNQEPLSVELAGEFSAGNVDVRQLDASYAESLLSARGVLGDRSDFTFSLNAPELATIASLFGVAASGSLDSSGQVEGSLTAPSVVAELLAKQLSWSDYRVDTLMVTADAGWRADAPFDFAVDASDLRFGDMSISVLDIDTNGLARAHELVVAATTATDSATLRATGGWREQAWQFASELVEVSITAPDRSLLTITAEPFAGEIAPDRWRVEDLCLAVAGADEPFESGVANAKANLCASAALSSSSPTARIDLSQFDVALVQPWLPEDLRLTGILSGSFVLPASVSQTTASVVWQAPSLALRDGATWLDPVRFDDSSLEIAPHAGDLSVSLIFPGERQRLRVDSRFTPLSNRGFSQWPLAANVELELPKLGFLASLSPIIQSLTGSMRGDAQIAGSLNEPVLSASVDLTLPTVSLLEPALLLTQTQLRLTSAGEELRVQASSRSGDGQIELTGAIVPSDEWRFDAHVSGDDFRISDSAEVRIDVSPDIAIEFDENLLKLSGQLAVPRADIVLAQLPEGAVTVSTDQIIVSEDAQQSATELDVSADLLLKLGESVTFQGLGLDASFGGELRLRERPGRATSATGEVVIKEGSYQAYGQDLTVERGRLLFAGGAIDSPGLDFRAARQATPDVRVGVDVRGSLKAPQLTVFSNPVMPSSDQIAYLVLGRPLSGSSSEEQSALRQAALALGVRGGRLVTDRLGEQLAVDSIGIESAPGTGNDQAALVIGKYLTPELYVSYGYGLFEPISTLRLEYQLNRLWRIVTESSNEATGGDIEWVMEK
ncbi:MAG: translocation/assembly module TamB domain-containing protein [Pseudomonadaceae bacterium]|nr:translocation/assembly module TamB domain-containing protein [Pseudomonadaceae bacterium]